MMEIKKQQINTSISSKNTVHEKEKWLQRPNFCLHKLINVLH